MLRPKFVAFRDVPFVPSVISFNDSLNGLTNEELFFHELGHSVGTLDSQWFFLYSPEYDAILFQELLNSAFVRTDLYKELMKLTVPSCP